MAKKFVPTYNLLDKSRPIVQDYLNYLKLRNSVWADKYIRGKPQNYKGDTVMSTYLFNNVWRDLDRYSREEIQMLRAAATPAEQLKIILIGRYCLSTPTLRLLLDKKTTLKDVYAHWEQCKKNPAQNFIRAAISLYPPKGFDRAMALVAHRDEVFARLAELEDGAMDANKPATYMLAKVPLILRFIGAFRAYEIYTSLTYTTFFNYSEDDIFHIGPGAVAGLKYVVGQDLSLAFAGGVLVDLRELVWAELNRDKGFVWIPHDLQGSPTNKQDKKFSLRNLEDTLCEFRKYTHLKNGKGRRRKYIAVPAELDI